MRDFLDKLYESFEVRERQGVGGKTFKFVASEDVIDRMNRVFGGQWCTEIIEREFIEDQILVKVRVWVTDPQSGKQFWHEGFASHDVARFNSGPRQGKPVSIGNDMKAATSKAIRTACTRWGVALYLDDEPSGNVSAEAHTPLAGPTPGPMGGPPSGPLGGPPNGPPDKPTGGPSGPPSTPAPPSGPAGGPSSPGPMSGPPSGPPNPGPMNMGQSSGGSSPAPTPSGPPNPSMNTNQDSDEGFMSTDDEDAQSHLTDVQKVAIQTIMEQHELDFPELLNKVFSDSSRASSIDTLSYPDAVTLIAAGNKLNRS